MKVEKPEGEDAVYTGCAYFTYDQNGNTTAWARHDEADALIEASYYTWDDENQLLSIQRLVGGTTYAFTYDGDYQRASMATAGSTNYYHWDGLNVMLERDASDATVRTHTHGPAPVAGIGTELGYRLHGGSPSDRWVQRDAVGSTWRETDESSPPGTEAAYEVSAWGETKGIWFEPGTQFLFCGKELHRDEPDADLIYFGRRYYAPSLVVQP